MGALLRLRGRRFGRDDELEALGRLIDRSPGLISLVGPGGVGKTRLAAEIAHERDALFVELADARGRGAILDALVAHLGLGGRPGAPAALIGDHLGRHGHRLVVLDNLEQLVPDAGDELLQLLAAAPGVRWLATSRRPIGLPGERTLRLHPLPRQTMRAIFLDRASGVRVGVLDDEVALEQVLDSLDGLPLAVELAASRLEVLPLRVLADRLGRRMDLLGRPEAPTDRHASMARVIDDSWDLLPDLARQALVQLSVFRGGVALDAAEGVLDLGSGTVIDALQLLVRHSLLLRHGVVAEQPRYAMLEVVRANVGARLDPELRGRARERHWRWFTERARAWGAGRWQSGPALPRLRAERANLLAAHRRALAAGSTDALAIAGAVHMVLVQTMPYDAHQGLLDRTVAAFVPLPRTADAARALLARGYLQLVRRDWASAVDTLVRSEGFAHESGDLDLELEAAGYLALAHSIGGDVEARRAQLRSIVVRAPEGHEAAINAQVRLANLEVWLGRPEAARDLMAPYADRVSAGADRLTAFFGYSYARSCGDTGDLETAERWWRIAVQVSSELALPYVAAEVRSGLAALLHTTGRSAEGREVLAPALDAAREDPEHHQLTWLMAGLLDLDDGAVEPALHALQIASRAGAHNDQGRFQAALAQLGLTLCALDVGDEARARDAFSELESRRTGMPMLQRPGVEPLVEGVRALVAADLTRAGESLAADAPGFARPVAQAARRVLASARRRAEARPVAADGSWFEGPDGARVGLARRPTLARVLATLVATDGPIPIDALFASGWPGQQVSQKSARNRVYVAVSTLRKLGLDEVEHTPLGYELRGCRRVEHG